MSKIITKHDRVAIDHDQSVHLCIRSQLNTASTKAIVFSHGFSVDGTESRRIFIEISNKLVPMGYTCFLFDYRGNGYIDLDFEDMTFDTLLADLNGVISHVKENYTFMTIMLWGVSFGCSVAAFAAKYNNSIDRVVLWCLSAELFRRYSKNLGDEIYEKGYTYISKGFKVRLPFLESLKNIDTYEAIKSSPQRYLLVHGDADPVAPIELSRRAHQISPDNTALIEIPGGIHGFKLQPDLYEMALEKTFEWILREQ